jgi:hypothetical protein
MRLEWITRAPFETQKLRKTIVYIYCRPARAFLDWRYDSMVNSGMSKVE